MNIEIVGATANQMTLTERALDVFEYPVDELSTAVTIAFVVEPSYPGTEEFAAATQIDSNEWLIEVRSNLDQLGRDPEGIYEGPEFFMETIIHEMGHVIAGIFLDTQEKRAMAVDCFLRHVQQPGYPSVPTMAHWNAGEWQEQVIESVAESIKDIWLPLGIRAYDNRTEWWLREASFGGFLALLDPYSGEGGERGAHLVHRTRNAVPGYDLDFYDTATDFTSAVENDEGWYWTHGGGFMSGSIVFSPENWEEVRQQFGSVRVSFSYEVFHDLTGYPPSVHDFPHGWGVMDAVNEYVDGLPGYEWGIFVILEKSPAATSIIDFRGSTTLWWSRAESGVAPVFNEEIVLPPLADYAEQMDAFILPYIGLCLYVRPLSETMTIPFGAADPPQTITRSTWLPSGAGNMMHKATSGDLDAWWFLSYSNPPLKLKGTWPYRDVIAAAPGPVLRVRRSLP